MAAFVLAAPTASVFGATFALAFVSAFVLWAALGTYLDADRRRVRARRSPRG
jgi:hypothetical protein